MQLDRTIILPSNNLTLAKKLFRSLIEDEAVLTMIVLGNDTEGNQAVTIADRRARVAPVGFERKVAWLTSSRLFNELKHFLSDGEIRVDSITPENTLCVAVSLTDQVMHKISKGSEIDFLVIERAFLKAGEL